MRSTFLLPLRCGPHATGSWTKQLAGALRTAAAVDPMSRVLWLMVGGLGSGTPQDSLTPDLITLLASAYDCTPEEAPCLDVVPLRWLAVFDLKFQVGFAMSCQNREPLHRLRALYLAHVQALQ